MKASELRIGNSIMQDDELVFVTWWRLELMEKNKIEYKPIPLTDEWLIKFGFNEMLGKFVINPNSGYNACVALRNNKWHLYNDDCDAECNIICEVETVHRLQNLFFDIWNFELEIKDDYYR